MEVSGRRARESEEHVNACDNCVTLRSISRAAFGYCIDCRDFLCEDCYHGHRDHKPLRHHMLLQGNQMPKERLQPVDMCQVHTDEKITYFCKEHNALACQKCAFLTHRLCKDVADIETVSSDHKQNQRYKDLTKRITTLESKTYNTRQIRLQNISIIDTNQNKAKADIKTFCKAMHDYLNKIENTVDKEVDAIGEEDKIKMDTILQQCDSVSSELKVVTTDLETNQDPSRKNELFIAIERATVAMETLEDRLATLGNDNTVREVRFEPDERLQSVMADVETLGQLSVRSLTKVVSTRSSKYNIGPPPQLVKSKVKPPLNLDYEAVATPPPRRSATLNVKPPLNLDTVATPPPRRSATLNVKPPLNLDTVATPPPRRSATLNVKPPLNLDTVATPPPRRSATLNVKPPLNLDTVATPPPRRSATINVKPPLNLDYEAVATPPPRRSATLNVKPPLNLDTVATPPPRRSATINVKPPLNLDYEAVATPPPRRSATLNVKPPLNLDTVAIETEDGIIVQTQSDEKICSITGSTMMEDNTTLAVADGTNNAVKLVDVRKKRVVSQINLSNQPWDITRVQPDQLAITLPDQEKIQFLPIEKTPICILLGRAMKVAGRCWGIDYNNDRLFVTFSRPAQVQILNMSGSVLKTISAQSDKQIRFIYPFYLTLSIDRSMLYVSSSSTSTVYCLDMDGGVKAIYKNQGLVGPRGVSTAEDGFLFVCGRNSHNLLVISTDCILGRVLLDKSHGIESPECVLYNSTLSTLYVGQDNSNTLKVFKLK